MRLVEHSVFVRSGRGDQRLYRKAVRGCGAGQEAAQRHPGRTQP